MHGIEGMVVISVTLDAAGRATDSLILSEEPNDELRVRYGGRPGGALASGH